MTESMSTSSDGPQEVRPPPGRIVRSFLRAAGSSAVLVTIYYLLPLDHSVQWLAVMMLTIGLAVLIGLVAYQVRATVGFGDITPTAGVARLVVTGQMIVDLIILGLGARVILGAVSRGRQRRPAEPGG